MTEHEVIEAKAVDVDAEGTQELALASQTPATLFRTDDPVQVLQRATETANALKDVLQRQNMLQNIQGRDHVKVEGWTTLGAMLGVTPVCAWTRPVEKGWEARVEARTLDGRIIGAAEAECLRSESTWKNRDDYALRSMAQTRATSKALGSVLRFVVTLAGYSGTPAEEMPHERQEAQSPPPAAKPTGPALDPKRVNALGKAIGALGLTYDDINMMLGACGIDALRAASGKALKERIVSLSPEQADALEAEVGRRADS
jgi:hypothetical protein